MLDAGDFGNLFLQSAFDAFVQGHPAAGAPNARAMQAYLYDAFIRDVDELNIATVALNRWPETFDQLSHTIKHLTSLCFSVLHHAKIHPYDQWSTKIGGSVVLFIIMTCEPKAIFLLSFGRRAAADQSIGGVSQLICMPRAQLFPSIYGVDLPETRVYPDARWRPQSLVAVLRRGLSRSLVRGSGRFASLAQLVEHTLGKGEVVGSSPMGGC